MRAAATSPAANTDGTPITRRLSSTGTRPNRSRAPGSRSVSALARMPAHHTTVAASSCSPVDSDTPSLLTAATLTPVLVSIPLSDKACSITGSAEEPMSEPMALRSTRTTRGVTKPLPNNPRRPLRELAGRLDPGQPGTDHDNRSRRRSRRIVGKTAQMVLQSEGTVMGVDVKTELPQAWHDGFDHLTAGRQHQAVVAVRHSIGRGDSAGRGVDRRYFGGDVCNSGGVEQVGKRD